MGPNGLKGNGPRNRRVKDAGVKKAQAALKTDLGREATPKEVADYLEAHPALAAPVPKSVTNPLKDLGTPKEFTHAFKALKKVLNREPTNDEIKSYIEKHPMKNTVNHGKDSAIYEKQAKSELKDLMGRNPTQKEVKQYMKDL